jgi:hypothetical protein
VSSVFGALTLLILAGCAWAVLEGVLFGERSDGSAVPPSRPPLGLLPLSADPEAVCAAVLEGIRPETVAVATANGDVDRITAMLKDTAFAAFWRLHLALCRGNLEGLAEAYSALKMRTVPLSPPWQAIQLHQEVNLSLAIAKAKQNPAAAYRGLDALRRLRLAKPAHDWPLDELEQELRQTLSGQANSSSPAPANRKVTAQIGRDVSLPGP